MPSTDFKLDAYYPYTGLTQPASLEAAIAERADQPGEKRFNPILQRTIVFIDIAMGQWPHS